MKKVLKWAAGIVLGMTVLAIIFGEEPKPPGERAGSSRASEVSTGPATRAEEPALPPVALAVDAPADGAVVRRGRVRVSGTAEPQATVRVAGEEVEVSPGGRWRRSVALQLGENHIAVDAAAPEKTDAGRTLTVTRRRSAAERAALRRARALRRQRREAARQARVAAFKASARTIPYNQLAKNPEKHRGAKVRYTGRIFQIQEEGGGTWMLLSVTDEGYGFWTDNVYVELDRTIRSAEEDVITVYGTVVGTHEYETQIGGQTFVPHLRGRYVEE